MSKHPITMATISEKDIVDLLKSYKQNEAPEIFEPILYFVSDLTGISTDALMGCVSEDENE